MAVDLYIKNPIDDSDYDMNTFDISDELLIYVNELRTIFTSQPDSVMGASDMSLNLDYYVFESGVSEDYLKSDISQKLSEYSMYYSMFNTSVGVNFLRGTENDICIVDVIVEDTIKLQFLVK